MNYYIIEHHIINWITITISLVSPGDTLATQNYVTNQMEHLKGVVKCSLSRSTMEKSSSNFKSK